MNAPRDPIGSGDEPVLAILESGESLSALFARLRVESLGFARDQPAPIVWDAVDKLAQEEVGA